MAFPSSSDPEPKPESAQAMRKRVLMPFLESELGRIREYLCMCSMDASYMSSMAAEFPAVVNNRPIPVASTLTSTSNPEPEPEPKPDPPQVKRKKVVIRSVYSYNLESEFCIINSVMKQYPYISMDTEFPGVVYHHVPGTPTPFRDRSSLLYYFLRKNVNALKLIQVGLTFSDADGNLPDLGLGLPCCFIWEFNLQFDLSTDLHNPDSIKLLMNSGIDFQRNYLYGIDPKKFGCGLIDFGLVLNRSVRWVTFHGTYDFAFLLKLIYRGQLPENRSQFLKLLEFYFGDFVYDVKHLMRFSENLHGGLERLARMLGVERVAGKSHQAASDSLLTWDAFLKLKQIYFADGVDKHAGVVYGL